LLRPSSKVNETAIWVIEAKASSPNSAGNGKFEERMSQVSKRLTGNKYSDEQIKEICTKFTPHPFDNYIEDICNKFINSFSLFISIRLQRHHEENSELSDNLKEIDLANVRFVFVLVISNCKAEWLPPIQSALDKTLSPTIKTWNLSPSKSRPKSPPTVLVLNEDMARSEQLIDLDSV
jgi:hypothetical protein